MIPPSNTLFKQVIQILLQVGIVVLIFGWCFMILAPFMSPIIWGLIIAITVYPLYTSLTTLLRGRKKIASTLITLLLLAIIIVPVVLLADSMVDGIRSFRAAFDADELVIPPPGPETANWPKLAKPLIDAWQMASDNLKNLVVTYRDQFAAVGKFILRLLATTGLGVLQFVLSAIISGFFLVFSEGGTDMLRRVFTKLSGDRGEKLMSLAEVTIRNVVKGILGVAAIQTLMAGLGMFLAGIPAAGLWTFFCLILAIIQVGVGPILIPAVIYVFANASTTTAIVFLVWCIIVMISDNFLKPFLLGRGAPVPMLVVFLGAIGGFIVLGFVGLFLGAVILSIGYELFQAWASEKDQEPAAGEKA